MKELTPFTDVSWLFVKMDKCTKQWIAEHRNAKVTDSQCKGATSLLELLKDFQLKLFPLENFRTTPHNYFLFNITVLNTPATTSAVLCCHLAAIHLGMEKLGLLFLKIIFPTKEQKCKFFFVDYFDLIILRSHFVVLSFEKGNGTRDLYTTHNLSKQTPVW